MTLCRTYGSLINCITLPGYDNSNLIMTYRYKIDDLVSDFGYSVLVEDGGIYSLRSAF
ncbi:MAG: hypothetical protein PHX08_02005 [Lachnospiraceae bacterium]|nr:hypothetical protein [Lachnospiraceae bacterium]